MDGLSGVMNTHLLQHLDLRSHYKLLQVLLTLRLELLGKHHLIITNQSLVTKYLSATAIHQCSQRTLNSVMDQCLTQLQLLCSAKSQFKYLELHHTHLHSTIQLLLKSRLLTQEDGQIFQMQIQLEKESRQLQLACHYQDVIIQLTQLKLLLFGIQLLLQQMETQMSFHTAQNTTRDLIRITGYLSVVN